MVLAAQMILLLLSFFFQAEDGIRDADVTGVQTCALPISSPLLNARLTTTHIAHHPSPPRTTPHNTTHTLHNVAPPQHTPLALGSAVATLRTTEHFQST